jgi:hypothetical protein
MLGAIRDWWDRRAGYRAAGHQIDGFKSGSFSDDEVIAYRPNYFVGRRGYFQGPFSRGWDQRWFEEGAKDARLGECHSQRFQSQYYDIGWSEQYAERRKLGWQNARLDAHLDNLWWNTKRNA